MKFNETKNWNVNFLVLKSVLSKFKPMTMAINKSLLLTSYREHIKNLTFILLLILSLTFYHIFLSRSGVIYFKLWRATSACNIQEKFTFPISCPITGWFLWTFATFLRRVLISFACSQPLECIEDVISDGHGCIPDAGHATSFAFPSNGLFTVRMGCLDTAVITISRTKTRQGSFLKEMSEKSMDA